MDKRTEAAYRRLGVEPSNDERAEALRLAEIWTEHETVDRGLVGDDLDCIARALLATESERAELAREVETVTRERNDAIRVQLEVDLPLHRGAFMSFEEAITRARAAHVKVESFRQPGNDYALEHRCSQGCGMFGTVFETNWEQHIVDAADRLMAEEPS